MLQLWGEPRQDARLDTFAGVLYGNDKCTMEWPYRKRELSAEEIQAEMDRIEAAIEEAESHGNRREDQHCD